MHYRLLLCLGQAAAGGVWAAPGGAGLRVGSEFGAPRTLLLSEGLGGQLGALGLELTESVHGATLLYRRGGELGYAALAMQSAGGEAWSAQLPAEAWGARGIQYFIEIADPPFTARLPRGAPAAGLESFVIGVTDYEAFALGAAPRDYFLGLSLAPASGDPQFLVGEALGAYGAPRWRLFTYDPAAAAYAEARAATPLVSGRGFWLSAGEAAFVAIDGSALDLRADVQLTLTPGWNAIADPFAFTLPIAALRFSDGRARNLYVYRPSALADCEDAARALRPAPGGRPRAGPLRRWRASPAAAGLTVCWQLTGTRQDAWARQHPLSAEAAISPP